MEVLSVAVISDVHAHTLEPNDPKAPSWLSLHADQSQPSTHPIAGLSALIKERGLSATAIAPTSIFGSSEFDIGKEEQQALGTAYAPGSSNYRRFSDLAQKDATFRKYLEQSNINLRRMHEIDDAKRAAQLRKLTSVVTVREAFLRVAADGVGESAPVRLRSRKKPQIYTGASALFAITEGNPRWIIGTLAPLLKAYAIDGATVRRTLQTKVVAVATDRFRALLSTVPAALAPVDDNRRSLLSIIDLIGDFFHKGVVRGPFRPEPPTSFRVDHATPSGVVDALAVALNVGAIVLVPETPDQKLLDTIVGNRFRLTYLLAPYYQLPLTTGKARALSSILSAIDTDLSTPDLFAP